MSLPFAPFNINQNRNAIQENNLTCQTCGFVFKNRLCLKAHNKRKQGKCKPRTKKSFFCELCPSSFAQRHSLSRHVSTKHGSPKIHLENAIARFKASDPEFDELQFLQDVLVAYISIQNMTEDKENEPIPQASPQTVERANTVADYETGKSPLEFGIDRFLEPIESKLDV